MTDKIFSIIYRWAEESDSSYIKVPENKEEAITLLRENGRIAWEGDPDERRHWITYTVVKKFPTEEKIYYIGYRDCKTTGDMTPREKGWKFSPDTIQEYKSIEVTQTIFKPKD